MLPKQLNNRTTLGDAIDFYTIYTINPASDTFPKEVDDFDGRYKVNVSKQYLLSIGQNYNDAQISTLKKKLHYLNTISQKPVFANLVLPCFIEKRSNGIDRDVYEFMYSLAPDVRNPIEYQVVIRDYASFDFLLRKLPNTTKRFEEIYNNSNGIKAIAMRCIRDYNALKIYTIHRGIDDNILVDLFKQELEAGSIDACALMSRVIGINTIEDALSPYPRDKQHNIVARMIIVKDSNDNYIVNDNMIMFMAKVGNSSIREYVTEYVSQTYPEQYNAYVNYLGKYAPRIIHSNFIQSSLDRVKSKPVPKRTMSAGSTNSDTPIIKRKHVSKRTPNSDTQHSTKTKRVPKRTMSVASTDSDTPIIIKPKPVPKRAVSVSSTDSDIQIITRRRPALPKARSPPRNKSPNPLRRAPQGVRVLMTDRELRKLTHGSRTNSPVRVGQMGMQEESVDSRFGNHTVNVETSAIVSQEAQSKLKHKKQ